MANPNSFKWLYTYAQLTLSNIFSWAFGYLWCKRSIVQSFIKCRTISWFPFRLFIATISFVDQCIGVRVRVFMCVCLCGKLWLLCVCSNFLNYCLCHTKLHQIDKDPLFNCLISFLILKALQKGTFDFCAWKNLKRLIWKKQRLFVSVHLVGCVSMCVSVNCMYSDAENCAFLENWKCVYVMT